MFVTEDAVPIARNFRTAALAERLGRAVGEALAAGLEEHEVNDLVRLATKAWRQQMERPDESSTAASPEETTP